MNIRLYITFPYLIVINSIQDILYFLIPIVTLSKIATAVYILQCVTKKPEKKPPLALYLLKVNPCLGSLKFYLVYTNSYFPDFA